MNCVLVVPPVLAVIGGVDTIGISIGLRIRIDGKVYLLTCRNFTRKLAGNCSHRAIIKREGDECIANPYANHVTLFPSELAYFGTRGDFGSGILQGRSNRNDPTAGDNIH